MSIRPDTGKIIYELQSKTIKPIEIEVTPAMIEAGALALASFDRRYESDEQGAMAIFEAMIAAS